MNSASNALSLNNSSDEQCDSGESFPPGTFPRPAWTRQNHGDCSPPVAPFTRTAPSPHRPVGRASSSTLPSSTVHRNPLCTIDEVDRGRHRVAASASYGETRTGRATGAPVRSSESLNERGSGSMWGLSSKLLEFNFSGPSRSSVGEDGEENASRKRQLRKTQSVEASVARGAVESCYSYGSSIGAFCEQLHSMHKEQQQQQGSERPGQLVEKSADDGADDADEVERSKEDQSDSAQSVNSKISSDKDYLGRIQFSVAYDFQEMTLTLKIFRAVDLPAKDLCGTSDPYVKILLLPDKKRKLTTNVKRKNLNPRWNEIFAFEGFPYNKLLTRTLYLQVIDYDRFSRDDPIGEVCVPLSDLDLAAGHTVWKTLQPCKGHTGKLGDLSVGLCYQPTVGRITVSIHSARQLKAKDINGLSDPYVKIWLMYEGKKTEKKKTAVKEKTLNPQFNESFVFDVPYERIRGTSISVSVMDHDRMGRNELIGQILLGTKSGPQEVKHWNDMFSRSRTLVTQWHVLKDFG